MVPIAGLGSFTTKNILYTCGLVWMMSSLKFLTVVPRLEVSNRLHPICYAKPRDGQAKTIEITIAIPIDNDAIIWSADEYAYGFPAPCE